MDRCGSLWVVPGFSNYARINQFATYTFIHCICICYSSLLKESKNLKMQAFLFLCVCVVCAHPNDWVCSQAFLLETMETGDKNQLQLLFKLFITKDTLRLACRLRGYSRQARLHNLLQTTKKLDVK